MPRSLVQRLLDIKEAATDLRDFVAAMDSEAFHELPHADRMGIGCSSFVMASKAGRP
jgi:hypothetical protein